MTKPSRAASVLLLLVRKYSNNGPGLHNELLMLDLQLTEPPFGQKKKNKCASCFNSIQFNSTSPISERLFDRWPQ